MEHLRIIRHTIVLVVLSFYLHTTPVVTSDLLEFVVTCHGPYPIPYYPPLVTRRISRTRRHDGTSHFTNVVATRTIDHNIKRPRRMMEQSLSSPPFELHVISRTTMNFLDTYDIASPNAQAGNQEVQQTLNEEVNQVVGQLSRFWGGFRKQVSVSWHAKCACGILCLTRSHRVKQCLRPLRRTWARSFLRPKLR